MSIAIALHVLAAVIWVGGMFFGYFCLRPSLGVLNPPDPMRAQRAILQRFFAWVAAAVLVLLVTGYWMIFSPAFGGFAGLPLHVNLMQGIGWIMFLVFGHLYFAVWPKMRRAADAEDWPEAVARHNTIRRIIEINLTLGIVTVAIAASGRFWS